MSSVNYRHNQPTASGQSNHRNKDSSQSVCQDSGGVVMVKNARLCTPPSNRGDILHPTTKLGSRFWSGWWILTYEMLNPTANSNPVGNIFSLLITTRPMVENDNCVFRMVFRVKSQGGWLGILPTPSCSTITLQSLSASISILL